MATLSEILSAFLDEADELKGIALTNKIRRLAVDCAAIVADYSAGEVPALLQRVSVALIWLAAETKDSDSRINRHGRQRAVLDLIDLAASVHAFHAGKGDDDTLLGMRAEIAAALRPLVAAADA